MTRVRGLLRDAWTIARPYWWSEDCGAASRLLLVVAVLNLGIVYINVLLNQWNNTFYNALQNRNYAIFVHQVVRFSVLAGAPIWWSRRCDAA